MGRLGSYPPGLRSLQIGDQTGLDDLRPFALDSLALRVGIETTDSIAKPMSERRPPGWIASMAASMGDFPES